MSELVIGGTVAAILLACFAGGYKFKRDIDRWIPPLVLVVLLASCVLNEDGETEVPPPCKQPVIDTTGMGNICRAAEMTQGSAR